jgi:hypothetical protein
VFLCVFFGGGDEKPSVIFHISSCIAVSLATFYSFYELQVPIAHRIHVAA